MIDTKEPPKPDYATIEHDGLKNTSDREKVRILTRALWLESQLAALRKPVEGVKEPDDRYCSANCACLGCWLRRNNMFCPTCGYAYRECGCDYSGLVTSGKADFHSFLETAHPTRKNRKLLEAENQRLREEVADLRKEWDATERECGPWEPRP